MNIGQVGRAPTAAKDQLPRAGQTYPIRTMRRYRGLLIRYFGRVRVARGALTTPTFYLKLHAVVEGLFGPHRGGLGGGATKSNASFVKARGEAPNLQLIVTTISSLFSSRTIFGVTASVQSSNRRPSA